MTRGREIAYDVIKNIAKHCTEEYERYVNRSNDSYVPTLFIYCSFELDILISCSAPYFFSSIL